MKSTGYIFTEINKIFCELFFEKMGKTGQKPCHVALQKYTLCFPQSVHIKKFVCWGVTNIFVFLLMKIK